MGRKSTVTLAIALLTFVLAPMASADEIKTPDGILIIPAGSQVTAVFVVPNSHPLIFGVDFQFPGGTGSNSGDFIDGDGSTIKFTVPVTNLSLNAVIGGSEGLLSADGFFFSCPGQFPNPSNFCPGPFSITISGPVTTLNVGTADGIAGIESMSFTTVDAGDPPTSSLIFLGFGLIGLLVSWRRKVPVCP
jgi:hypothetical protein